MNYTTKKFLKKVAIVLVVLYVLTHVFGCDIRGTCIAAKTLVVDTVEKIIPADARRQFEDIDSQINGVIVKSGVSSTLGTAAQKTLKTASNFLGRAWLEVKRVSMRFGINLNIFGGHSGISSGGSSAATASSGSKGGYALDYKKMDIAQANAIRQSFINYGMSLRGVPYVIGGESPSGGFDCSGFVRYAAKNGIGVQLPRTARAQYAATVKISSSEREPGDLLFFRSFGKIDHVGIYLGRYQGDGPLHGREIFLNAASRGKHTGVIVSALVEPYWRAHYSSAGRFLPSSLEVIDNEE